MLEYLSRSLLCRGYSKVVGPPSADPKRVPSARARKSRSLRRVHVVDHGTTRAGAEETPHFRSYPSHDWVHPRARKRLHELRGSDVRRRFTRAGAEETRTIRSRSRRSPVHPRARGRDLVVKMLKRALPVISQSPPRGSGALAAHGLQPDHPVAERPLPPDAVDQRLFEPGGLGHREQPVDLGLRHDALTDAGLRRFSRHPVEAEALEVGGGDLRAD